MKGLVVAILLLLAIHQKASSQINEEDLLGTWFPVMEQYEDGDTSFFDLNSPIWAFEQDGIGRQEVAGNNAISYPFTYNISGDSLEINGDNGHFRFRLTKGANSSLKIHFDPMSIVTFIHIPSYNTGIDLAELKSALDNDTWEFSIIDYGHSEPFSILYQFESQLEDSSIVRHYFHGTTFSLKAYKNGLFADQRGDFWSIGEHEGTQILSIRHEFSWMSSLVFILKKYQEGLLEFSTWEFGRKLKVIARRINKPNFQVLKRNSKILTQTKWQFYSEYIPPPDTDTTNIMDLGMVKDDFEELDDKDYRHDSTAVVQQTDLNEKLLLLEFQQDGNYKISREDRILDQGTWKYFFNQTVIQLSSNKEPYKADGIYGGDIKIESINKKEIKIYRNFRQLLNDNNWDSYSYLETYKPYRKRK